MRLLRLVPWGRAQVLGEAEGLSKPVVGHQKLVLHHHQLLQQPLHCRLCPSKTFCHNGASDELMQSSDNEAAATCSKVVSS